MKIKPYVGPFGLSEANDRRISRASQKDPTIRRGLIYQDALDFARRAAKHRSDLTVRDAFNAYLSHILIPALGAGTADYRRG